MPSYHHWLRERGLQWQETLGKGDPELPVQERSPTPANSCPAPVYAPRLRGAWLMKQGLQMPPRLKTDGILPDAAGGRSKRNGSSANSVMLGWRTEYFYSETIAPAVLRSWEFWFHIAFFMWMSVFALFGVFRPRRCKSPKP